MNIPTPGSSPLIPNRPGRTVSPAAAVCCLLLLVLAGSGCQPRLSTARLQTFSEATHTTAEGMEATFLAVNQEYRNTQVSKKVLDYNPKKGFNPTDIEPFLDEDEIQARLQVLDALKAYASAMLALKGDDQLDEFDEQTRKLGAALQGFTTEDGEHFLSETMGAEAHLNVITTAVNSIGRAIIERKRDQGLREIITDMSPHVDRICDLLILDIGPKYGPGLRAQMSNQFNQQITNLNQYISDNYPKGRRKRFRVLELRGELYRLVNLWEQKEQADRSMISMVDALENLKLANQQLPLAMDQDASRLNALSRAMGVEAERARRFFRSLSADSDEGGMMYPRQ